MAHEILFVDDDDDHREPLAILIQLKGYVVTAVADGFEALRLLRGGLRPCVIVLDLYMPRMPGEEFRRQQLIDPAIAAIPVILYSSGEELSDVARDLGVQGHATKPHVDKLLDLLSLHC